MAKATGFLEYTREEAPKRLVHQRVKDYKEFEQVDSILHAEILEALGRRDAKMASDKLAEHINHYLTELYEMYELQNQEISN